MAGKKTLEEKVAEACGSEVADGIIGMCGNDLRAKLVLLDLHEKETQDKMEVDQTINDLKEELANAKGPYMDGLKGIKLMRRLCVTRLQEQGKG